MTSRKKIIRTTQVLSLLAVALLPITVGAETLPNPLGTINTVQGFIGQIIKAALGISGSIALAIFVYGGFLFMLGAADPKNVQKGKEAMLYAVIGLVIIFGSYALVDFVIGAITGATNVPGR